MRMLVVLVALIAIATACQATPTTQSEPAKTTSAPSTREPTTDAFDGPDAVVAFIILSNPDPSAFDDAFAEAERAARRGELVLSADVADCDIARAAALPQPEQVAVRFYSEPIDCAVAVNYRAIFLVPRAGTNWFGAWNYDTTPDITIETLELSN